MIYVTVGSPSSHGFYRLIKKIDDLAPEISDPVVMQIGDTKYKPSHATYFKYNIFSESIKLFEEANLVISHCSTGSILNAKIFRSEKPTIVIPRRKEYKEHLDNHQMELAKLIEKEGDRLRIYVIYEVEHLRGKINELLTMKYHFAPSEKKLNNPLVDYLKDFIYSLNSPPNPLIRK